MSWRAFARRYPVLAIRDFRLLLADRLLAPFSVGFSIVGVSFAVLKVTGSTADLSYVIAAQTAPMLVFSLVSGVFADRFRPQRVIVAGNLAVVVGEGVFGLLMLATGHPPLWAMINTIVRSRTFGGAMDDAGDLVQRLRERAEQAGLRILGPAPAPLGRLRGEYRTQILVKGANRKKMREALLAAIASRPDLERRVVVDVDPVSVL